jgi:hypothetical protein
MHVYTGPTFFLHFYCDCIHVVLKVVLLLVTNYPNPDRSWFQGSELWKHSKTPRRTHGAVPGKSRHVVMRVSTLKDWTDHENTHTHTYIYIFKTTVPFLSWCNVHRIFKFIARIGPIKFHITYFSQFRFYYVSRKTTYAASISNYLNSFARSNNLLALLFSHHDSKTCTLYYFLWIFRLVIVLAYKRLMYLIISLR